jgi:hypothetical protein
MNILYGIYGVLIGVLITNIYRDIKEIAKND